MSVGGRQRRIDADAECLFGCHVSVFVGVRGQGPNSAEMTRN